MCLDKITSSHKVRKWKGGREAAKKVIFLMAVGGRGLGGKRKKSFFGTFFIFCSVLKLFGALRAPTVSTPCVKLCIRPCFR